MSEVTRAILKGYFETDDVPTEAQFINLIDSCVNIVSDSSNVYGEYNIVAYAGGGQANATELTKLCNHIGTCATINDSVKAKVSQPGMLFFIVNKGAQTCDIYPPSGGQIDLSGMNNPITLAAGKSVVLFCPATNLLFSLRGA